jgi:hypothetical protein
VREGLSTKDPCIPDDSGTQTSARPVEPHCRGGAAECTGPSLAFVPLRGTKDYAQDDSLVGPEMMSFRLFQAVRYRNTFPLDNLSFRELNIQ